MFGARTKIKALPLYSLVLPRAPSMLAMFFFDAERVIYDRHFRIQVTSYTSRISNRQWLTLSGKGSKAILEGLGGSRRKYDGGSRNEELGFSPCSERIQH